VAKQEGGTLERTAPPIAWTRSLDTAPEPPGGAQRAKPPDHVNPMIGSKLATVIKKSRIEGGKCHPRFGTRGSGRCCREI
jgi:hypothetical protein